MTNRSFRCVCSLSLSWRSLRRCLFSQTFYTRPVVQSTYLSQRRGVYTSKCLMKVDELETNPYYHKYAEKIKQIKRDGESELKRKRREEGKFEVDHRAQIEAEKFKQKIKASQKFGMKMTSESGTKSSYKEKTLDSVVHLERLKGKTAEEINEIWREHHRTKDCVSAVIESEKYDQMMERAKSCPLFIYPLPREMGYEFIFAEFSGNQCYFTSLINYQTLGQNAPWIMVLTHFPELKEQKGIVLMVGEVDTDVLSVFEAQWLAYQVQMYYASDKPRRLDLLNLFNHDPNKFDHMDVVNELTSELGNNKSLNT